DARARQGGPGPRRVLRLGARGGQSRPRGAPPRRPRRAPRGRGSAAMSTFEMLADLPLEVDGYTLEGLRAEVSSGFERLSTVVHLHGGGVEGVGEDVVYDAEDQVALQEAGATQPLAGRYTLSDFCELI